MGGLAVVDADVVDYDVGDGPEGEAGAVGDVDVGSATVDGFEGADEELGGECDFHGGGEGDPQRGGLDGGVAEGSGFGIGRVGVGGVGDDVGLAVSAAEGGLAKADGAVGEVLAVGAPVGSGAAPAVVDGVAC